MFHATAMVADYDRAIARLGRLAGLRVLEYSEQEHPAIGRRGGMCWIGDQSIEIGQPIVPTGGAAKFVARTGGGMHSVAVQVADIEQAIRRVEAHGVPVAARPRAEMFFTDPRATGGVFVEWGAFELDIDPHFGADPPPIERPPLLDVQRVAWVGALVDDPVRTAGRLAALFGTEMVRPRLAGLPDAAVSLGDCMLALFALGGRDWGRDYPRPRCHVLALEVCDRGERVEQLAREGFPVVHHDATGTVLDPVGTGDVHIVLVDTLLPGDPRTDVARDRGDRRR